MIKCKVKTNASKELSRSNGGSYVIQNAMITEGIHAGKIIAVQRTLVNAENAELKEAGEEYVTKNPFTVGEIITAYPTTIKGNNGKFITFFEGQGEQTVSLEDATDIAKAYSTEVVAEKVAANIEA